MKISFYAKADPQVGDSDIVFYKCIKVRHFWCFKFSTEISYGTETEMKTLADNLTKIYGTT